MIILYTISTLKITLVCTYNAQLVCSPKYIRPPASTAWPSPGTTPGTGTSTRSGAARAGCSEGSECSRSRSMSHNRYVKFVRQS